MDAAGRFACCVQTGNRIALDVENLGFFVDFKTAHGVVNARQKILWILTIVVLNWIGLLLYYYTYYIKKN